MNLFEKVALLEKMKYDMPRRLVNLKGRPLKYRYEYQCNDIQTQLQKLDSRPLY